MIKIVPATVNESQEIRRLETKIWGEEVVNKYDIPMFIRFGWCFVAKDQNRIVGAIYAYQTRQDQVYVSDWIVDEKYRVRNIGINLYKKLIRKVDRKSIVSFIDPKNTASLAAHKKLGFKIVRIVPNAYGLTRGIKGGDRILVRLNRGGLSKMLSIIRRNPGIRPKDLNKRLGLKHSAGLRNSLIKRGLVRKERKGPTVHYFPVKDSDI